MSTLSSVEDVQLQQQCDNCKRSEKYKVIGKLSFCRNCKLGGYWTDVFRGKFEGKGVAVKRIIKHKTEIITTVESETLRRVNGHPNIVHYYITEQDEDFWYVNLSYETKDNIIKICNEIS